MASNYFESDKKERLLPCYLLVLCSLCCAILLMCLWLISFAGRVELHFAGSAPGVHGMWRTMLKAPISVELDLCWSYFKGQNWGGACRIHTTSNPRNWGDFAWVEIRMDSEIVGGQPILCDAFVASLSRSWDIICHQPAIISRSLLERAVLSSSQQLNAPK